MSTTNELTEKQKDEKEFDIKLTKSIMQVPEKLLARFKMLKVLSDQRSDLDDQQDEEIKKLEKEYFLKMLPLWERRARLIKGEEEPAQDLIDKFDAKTTELEG